jgi:hypothetical protein
MRVAQEAAARPEIMPPRHAPDCLPAVAPASNQPPMAAAESEPWSAHIEGVLSPPLGMLAENANRARPSAFVSSLFRERIAIAKTHCQGCCCPSHIKTAVLEIVRHHQHPLGGQLVFDPDCEKIGSQGLGRQHVQFGKRFIHQEWSRVADDRPAKPTLWRGCRWLAHCRRWARLSPGMQYTPLPRSELPLAKHRASVIRLIIDLHQIRLFIWFYKLKCLDGCGARAAFMTCKF